MKTLLPTCLIFSLTILSSCTKCYECELKAPWGAISDRKKICTGNPEFAEVDRTKMYTSSTGQIYQCR